MTDNDNKQLSELMKNEADKGYQYMRWLVLIAGGAFSLSFSVLLKEDLGCLVKLFVKLALTFNALGVLAGVVAVFGEANLATGAKCAQLDKMEARSNGTYSGEPVGYALPSRFKWLERACFSFLILAIVFWVLFIWFV